MIISKQWLKDFVSFDYSTEELADMLEVIYRISELRGITSNELENIKNEKAKKRGKFNDNLFLVDTD